MMSIPVTNSSGQKVARLAAPAGKAAPEGGFVLVFVMFLLAICTILGMAAMQTSVDETIISGNEVMVKKVFSIAESGLPLASIPVARTDGEGFWTTDCVEPCSAACANPVYLDDDDPDQTADSGAIEILDGNFLFEGRDFDMAYNTRWNNWNKYSLALDESHQNAFKPLDDPFYGSAADKTAKGVDSCPDIRIRTRDLVVDVDVDKVAVKYAFGGVAEFGSGADGAAGMAVKVSYVFNCKATMPNRRLDDENAPKSEQLIGWGLMATGS